MVKKIVDAYGEIAKLGGPDEVAEILFGPKSEVQDKVIALLENIRN
jgi:hypothetical protein